MKLWLFGTSNELNLIQTKIIFNQIVIVNKKVILNFWNADFDDQHLTKDKRDNKQKDRQREREKQTDRIIDKEDNRETDTVNQNDCNIFFPF